MKLLFPELDKAGEQNDAEMVVTGKRRLLNLSIENGQLLA
jgi:hypothetical protein